MSNLYGVWIDHAHAFIVKSDSMQIQSSKTVYSEVEPNHRTGQHSERLTMTDPLSDNKRRIHQFHDYSKQLRDEIKDANEILLFGPGEAKNKFAAELKALDHVLADRVKAVETADSMTENQLHAYVKKFFQLPRKA